MRIAGGAVFPTDKQTTAHLLCEKCEDVLNRGGETWVTPKLATTERKFPLHELITNTPPAYTIDETSIYFASTNSNVRVDQLVHFAIGIFWKASVHSWQARGIGPRIELGPYSKALRLWLLGEGLLPVSVALSVSISSPNRAQITFNEPHEASRSNGRTYILHVPGMLSILYLGKHLSPEITEFCLHHSPMHPIFVSEEITTKVEEMFASMFRKARKTDAFMRAKAARDRDLRGQRRS